MNHFPAPIFRAAPLYSDGKYGLTFTLEKIENGSIVIHREKSADFDLHHTDIIIPAAGGIIEISHTEKKMMPEWRYKFEAPDNHCIAALAKEIIDKDGLNQTTAQQLSRRIDMELDACKEKRTGRIIQAEGGWRECIARSSKNAPTEKSPALH